MVVEKSKLLLITFEWLLIQLLGHLELLNEMLLIVVGHALL